MSVGSVEVAFEIDDSKVTVLTRIARLRGLAAAYLTSMRDAAQAAGDPHDDLANLDEAILWLNEIET